MGFTIDMVSGEILDETNVPGNVSVNEKQDRVVSNQHSKDISESEYSEQLIIVEPESDASFDVGMPESIVHVNLDTFLDGFNDI